jgi:SulP family sulfate permease
MVPALSPDQRFEVLVDLDARYGAFLDDRRRHVHMPHHGLCSTSQECAGEPGALATRPPIATPPIPSSLPFLGLPDVPITLDALLVILPLSITRALVGLLESLLTAQNIDDLTDTNSDKNLESRCQGIANIFTGFIGAMAVCAMIGQSMINYHSGGWTRLSTLAAGVFLLILILVLGDLVAQIPMAVLVAVMIMVSVGTFDWRSISPETLRMMPHPETAVMVATVGVVVLTHNLAYGVGVGVLLSTVFFVRHFTHLVKVTSVVDRDNTERIYAISGELFFASTNDRVHSFGYDAVQMSRVEIDLIEARIWDTSAVVALDAVVAKFAQRGISDHMIGLNRQAEHLHSRATGKVSVGR